MEAKVDDTKQQEEIGEFSDSSENLNVNIASPQFSSDEGSQQNVARKLFKSPQKRILQKRKVEDPRLTEAFNYL